MESLARFVRSHIYGSNSVAAANPSRPEPNKARDCVYILGPGHDQTMAHELRRRAMNEGLTTEVIGDGKSGLNREMIRQARAEGLIGPNTQVVCLLHGGTRRVEGTTVKSHVLHTGFDASGPGRGGQPQKTKTPTTEFLHWLRDSVSVEEGLVSPLKTWEGTVHLVSCHVREFAKEFSSAAIDPNSGKIVENSLWTRGNVLAYGSSKPIMTEVGLQNFDALLRHLGECKREGQVPEISETFRRVMVDSADTVSLLGGSLSEPVVSHAPKSLLEATPGFLQARWQQLMAYEKLNASVTSVPKSERIQTARGRAPASDLPPMTRQKSSQFFFTRIGHLKKDNKFQILKSDLNRYPWLANVRNEREFTPLMLVALRSDKYKVTEVDASGISNALLDAGAEINAQNATGKTALHYAAGEGNVGLIALFLRKGALPAVVDHDKRSPLHWACMSKGDRVAAVEAMLSGCDKALIDKRDRFGKSALHIAIAAGDVDVVKKLLDAGADPDKRTGGWESPKDLARRAPISDQATDKIVSLLNQARAAKKMPRRSGA